MQFLRRCLARGNARKCWSQNIWRFARVLIGLLQKHENLMGRKLVWSSGLLLSELSTSALQFVRVTLKRGTLLCRVPTHLLEYLWTCKAVWTCKTIVRVLPVSQQTTGSNHLFKALTKANHSFKANHWFKAVFYPSDSHVFVQTMFRGPLFSPEVLSSRVLCKRDSVQRCCNNCECNLPTEVTSTLTKFSKKILKGLENKFIWIWRVEDCINTLHDLNKYVWQKFLSLNLTGGILDDIVFLPKKVYTKSEGSNPARGLYSVTSCMYIYIYMYIYMDEKRSTGDFFWWNNN